MANVEAQAELSPIDILRRHNALLARMNERTLSNQDVLNLVDNSKGVLDRTDVHEWRVILRGVSLYWRHWQISQNYPKDIRTEVSPIPNMTRGQKRLQF